MTNEEPQTMYVAKMDTAEKAVEVLKHLNPDAVENKESEEVFQAVPTENMIPDLLSNLSEEQKAQLQELQNRMQLYQDSRSGHKPGDTHEIAGVSYVVSESGAYKRLSPKKSKKAEHRKKVAESRK